MRHYPWQRIFALLTIVAVAAADRGLGQETNGSPDGLYVVPQAGHGSGAVQDDESASSRSAKTYLSSLDPQGARFQRELAEANAAQKKAADVKKTRYLVAHGSPAWTTPTIGVTEPLWIAMLAGAGLFLSLAAAGCVWWSHKLHTKGKSSLLLSVKPGPAPKPGGTRPAGAEKRKNIPKRRAA